MRMFQRMGASLGLLILLTGGASAAETQWWTSDGASDYAKAESKGVIVHADGTLELGPEIRTFADDSLKSVWAIAVMADGSIALGGDHGRIDRWTAAGGIRPWVRLGAGQVLSLARDGDGLVAGLAPRGIVYRIGAKGDTTTLCRTGERYIWGLAPGERGAWWAATGTRGRLLQIVSGKARIVYDTDESNLVCLVSDGAGGVFAGGDSKGRVYHALAGGGVRTEFDASEDEIRALARTSDGVLWAAGLSVSAAADEGGDDEKPAPVRAVVAGGRSTLYRLVPDSAATAYWISPQPLVFALAATPAGVVAGTGNRAGIFRIERSGGASQWLAPPQGQVTALATGEGGAVWAATSNPVVLHRLGPASGSDGELISPALDAKHFSRFGRLRWHGKGDARFLTRSGNADPADSTWTPWQGVSGDADGARILSPAARYLQWKVQLSSATTRVEDVSISWREQNLPPRVDDLSVAPQAQGFRDGELGARSEAVTQSLAGGQKVEYSVSLPANKAIRELPVWSRGLRTLQWHGSDPNGDALRYRLEVKREDEGGAWVEIGKDLEATFYTWNTNTLPDGRYRVRVTANDALGNAVGEERTATAMSEPFAVDNTPPAITTLEGRGAHLEGAADDASSPVIRLELAIDDGDWRTLAPLGGMADAPHLKFALDVPGLKPGEHLLSVRAIDLAGNAVTRAVHVQIAAGGH